MQNPIPKILTIDDFERHDSMATLGHYFETRLPSGEHICIESCMDGYCVGKYPAGVDVATEKHCTDLGKLGMTFPPFGGSMENQQMALLKALDIANTMV